MEEGILIYETHGMYTATKKRNAYISCGFTEIRRSISMCSSNYNNYACTIITIRREVVVMPTTTIRDIEDTYKDKQATQEWN